MARLSIPAMLVAGLAGLTALDPAAGANRFILAAADCGGAAARVVGETGGQLLSAQPSSDGRTCVVTVLVQGGGNERPRKVTVRVPM